MQFQIKSRWNSETVLFSCELTAEVAAQSYSIQLGFAVMAAVKSGANLRGANLSGANLSDAYLSDAYLSDANLRSANLSDANLRGANLSGANLSDAYLSDAYLSDANLRGANLSDANLSGANLSGANLSDAYLSCAYLSGAYLSGANLSGANLSDAYLSCAYLSGANLFDEKIIKPVTQLLTEIWPVIIGETKIKIGCQLHTIAEWQSFDDYDIADMASDALAWWRVWKSPIMEICKATGKLPGGDNAGA